MRVLIAFAALTIASSVSAQNPGGIPWEDPPDRRMTIKRPSKGEWMLGVDGGFANNLRTDYAKRGTRFVGFVERNVAPWLGLQADLNCGKSTVLASGLSPSSTLGVCTGALSAVIPIPVAYSLWPYVRLGGGLSFWDERAVEGIWDGDDVSPAYVAAVGAKYFPFNNDKIAVRIDVQRFQSTLQDRSVGQWGVGFGVGFRIP